jgi:hypothetical protein
VNHAIDIGIIDRYSNQGLEIILESCVFLVFNLCEIVLLAIEEEEEEKEGQLWLKMVAQDPINRTCPCNSLVRDGFDFFFTCTKTSGPAAEVRFSCLCHLVRASTCTPVTFAVSYLPTGLTGCLVDPEISYSTCKLARRFHIKKNK